MCLFDSFPKCIFKCHTKVLDPTFLDLFCSQNRHLAINCAKIKGVMLNLHVRFGILRLRVLPLVWSRFLVNRLYHDILYFRWSLCWSFGSEGDTLIPKVPVLMRNEPIWQCEPDKVLRSIFSSNLKNTCSLESLIMSRVLKNPASFSLVKTLLDQTKTVQ